MDWLLKTPITHRGLFDNRTIPENSLLAFEASAKAGYPIELDVRMLIDGQLAVFHDISLLRMTGQKGSILKKNSGELKQFHLLDTNETIPLLQETLELVSGRVPLLIEIKNRKRIGKLEYKLLSMLLKYKGEYAVESFNPWVVKWFSLNAPHIWRGQLSGGLGKGHIVLRNTLLRIAMLSKQSHPDFIAFDINHLPARAVTKLKAKGCPVIGYTAKSKEQFKQAMNYCDNVIFEGFVPSEKENSGTARSKYKVR
ncbi:MAG: glycerophosphodiester phosphodiesterase family protein [Ignavibacteria bacterium]